MPMVQIFVLICSGQPCLALKLMELKAIQLFVFEYVI